MKLARCDLAFSAHKTYEFMTCMSPKMRQNSQSHNLRSKNFPGVKPPHTCPKKRPRLTRPGRSASNARRGGDRRGSRGIEREWGGRRGEYLLIPPTNNSWIRPCIEELSYHNVRSQQCAKTQNSPTAISNFESFREKPGPHY